MSEAPELLRIEEYRALRATIRERGSVRFLVTVITFSAWGAAIIAVCSMFLMPMFGVVPLLVLGAGFEVVFAIHVGVERIGRYLQVHHEPAALGLARWEQTAMAARLSSGGVNPLLPVPFMTAALANFALSALLPLDVELGNSALWIGLPSALLHLAFVARVATAARFAAGQRKADLREFERILKDPNN